ncbi:MAG: PD-(D/E)XK nuclease family protein [Oscillospiraceae bacterium]|nr:PD-(D/E)XK nuclease family protein [Oscillospiraceae bacterium]
MVNLIVGRAGTGKTKRVRDEMKQRMDAGETQLLLIVPEQYSHDAEKQLCDVCGDELALHGETLSFTRLCGRVFLELGYPDRFLDGGGQMLVMHRAIESVAMRLRAFGAKGIRIELLESMLATMKEFKGLRITAAELEHFCTQVSDPLSAKLHDLALISNAYDALLNVHGGDLSDMIELLIDVISESSLGDTGHIYFDGFNDFTAQELRVIEELMRKNTEITVCLTYDIDDDNEIFELPRRTAEQLRKLSKKYDVEVNLITQEPGGSDKKPVPTAQISEMCFIEKHLFTHDQALYPGQSDAITIYRARTRHAECEFAAGKVLELVQAGYRWRDIGVMSRDWQQYSSICENVFEKFEIPFFSSGRADILDKPPVAHIDAALDIITSGWEYRPVFRYLKTGLIDITSDECSELENYVLKWNIRGSMWLRDWILPPSGYGGNVDTKKLEKLNGLRQSIIKPILKLRDDIKGESLTSQKLRALYLFLEEIKLPKLLDEKGNELKKSGENRLADEYFQLWDIIVVAMEQMFTIHGDLMVSVSDFRKIFALVLSMYDVGVIPVSLDRTALGSMDMSRRRDIKCLILLGATDENMPMLSKGSGALSEHEKEELGRLVGFPSGLEESYCREMNMLYSVLTLPSQELVVTYPYGGARASFIVKRLKAMFAVSELEAGDLPPMPYGFETDANALAIPVREKLSDGITQRLYGSKLSLSPSRVDKYYSCPFQHYLQSGLKLRPRTAAVFDAPMIGTFVHYVLEGVSKEIKCTAGFKNAGEEIYQSLAKKYIEQYVKDELLNFEGRNERFIYLFRRLELYVLRILTDMLEELRCSDFEPLDFERDISTLKNMGDLETADGVRPMAQKAEAAQGLHSKGVMLSGIVDRIDGWKVGEKHYLRVIDYKTGKKSFSLSDLMYGRDMQMLIYLFALENFGSALYGGDIIPAGVLYVPARDALIKASRNLSDEDIKKSISKELRRGGLLLNDPTVIDAMETGEEKRYLPLKISKDGGFSGDSLIDPEQIMLLEKHIEKMLNDASANILGGVIECSPFYKSEKDNACMYCDYHAVCTFDNEHGKRRFARKRKTADIWDALKKGMK